MSGVLTFRLKDKSELVSLIINIPPEYSVSRLLVELIDACGLPYMDKGGRLSRKYILQYNNQFLPPHSTFGQFKILRGQVIYLCQVTPGQTPTAQELAGISLIDQNDDDDSLGSNGFFQSFSSGASLQNSAAPLWKEEAWRSARKFQAAGADEKALVLFLQLWRIYHNRHKSTTDSGGSRLETLNRVEKLEKEVINLFYQLIGSQLEATEYGEFLRALKDEATIYYLDVYPTRRVEARDTLIKNSYKLAKAQRYQDALDLAALAREIDDNSELAGKLIHLAQLYLEFLAADRLEVKAEKANAILELNPQYGNIKEDSHNLLKKVEVEV